MNRSNLISIPVIPDEWISTEIATIFVFKKNKSESKESSMWISKRERVSRQECFLPKFITTYYEVQLGCCNARITVGFALQSVSSILFNSKEVSD